MKKKHLPGRGQNKGLRLNRETVAHLTPIELASAVGGDVTKTSCGFVCTWSTCQMERPLAN